MEVWNIHGRASDGNQVQSNQNRPPTSHNNGTSPTKQLTAKLSKFHETGPRMTETHYGYCNKQSAVRSQQCVRNRPAKSTGW